MAQVEDLDKTIREITQTQDATIGVAVVFDDSTTYTLNNESRYPTLSVYKFHLALAVLDYLNRNNLPLSTEIFVPESDLLPDTYSPLRDEKLIGNFNISIKELLEYSISRSDNNACDILFKYIGGTDVVNQYIKGLGFENISIAATEEVMHKKTENQYLNWTSPLASTQLLTYFLNKNLFSDVYKDFLIEALIKTSTGKDKLKALLPPDLVVGHKTGSSSRNEFGVKVAENDLGFVSLPNGKRYSIGVFIMDSKEDDKTNSATIAKISRAVYDFYLVKQKQQFIVNVLNNKQL